MAKGDSVYIDDDARRMMQLKGKIRFVDTNELGVVDCESFYGLLCGVVPKIMILKTFMSMLYQILLIRIYQNQLICLKS